MHMMNVPLNIATMLERAELFFRKTSYFADEERACPPYVSRNW